MDNSASTFNGMRITNRHRLAFRSSRTGRFAAAWCTAPGCPWRAKGSDDPRDQFARHLYALVPKRRDLASGDAGSSS